MAAFSRAQHEGALAIETDVRLTKAGEVVLCHDATVEHVTVGRDRRRVADLDATAVDEVGLARLEDLLAWASRTEIAVNVEIKNDPRPLALVRAVARIVRRSDADVLVSSFERALVGAFTALVPNVPVAWLTRPGQNRAVDRFTRERSPSLCFAVHPELSQASKADFARWKERGLRIGVYTVNDTDDASRLVAMGADWIVTDQPAAMSELLHAG
jgi:glycerophosphoryl diester phosphodiesterase